jgi:hypothetical protein
MIEVALVVAISLGATVIAVPIITNALNSYYQNAAVSATSGALAATRFQAIMHGYSYQLVLTPASMSYQIYNEVPPATTFSLVVPAQGSSTTPLSSASGITMTMVTCSAALTNWACTPSTDQTAVSGSTLTYTFAPNGTVTTSPTGTSPAGVGIQIKNTVKSNTMWISGVGDVGTSSP